MSLDPLAAELAELYARWPPSRAEVVMPATWLHAWYTGLEAGLERIAERHLTYIGALGDGSLMDLERRTFIERAALAFAVSPLLACEGGSSSQRDGTVPDGTATGDTSKPEPPSDAVGRFSDIVTAPECPDPLAALIEAGPEGTLDFSEMPYRQDDPRWTAEIMWDRDQVLKVATEFNGESPEIADALIREYPEGNTIGNEGCMLTCIAMVLRLLVPNEDPPWTPATLNALAQLFYYYTPSGLSLTTLYGDLVSDSSVGEVQLVLKEDYLPAQTGWPKVYANTSPLVRAYRSLPVGKRADILLMVKSGTYLDTVASHYSLLHPDDTGGPEDPDPLILDPAMPLTTSGPWRLTDSANQVTLDEGIAAAWEEDNIEPTQLGGVWVFTRWPADRRRTRLGPLLAAWARELAKES